MSRRIDYYLAPQSPWTYLGHDRFVALARAAGATVRVLPADLGAETIVWLLSPAASYTTMSLLDVSGGR